MISIPGNTKGKTAYEITDVIGKTILKGEQEHAGIVSIPVSALPSGVYFIRLTANEQSAVKKFVKE